MTSRERMMCAMRGETPDRMPVAPDISNMVPCKLTGKPFWDENRLRLCWTPGKMEVLYFQPATNADVIPQTLTYAQWLIQQRSSDTIPWIKIGWKKN